MKREILLLVLFGVVIVGGFLCVTLSVAKVFVANVNSMTASYYPEGNNGVGE